ncbi:MAG: immune inhibitor A [Dehalococcoidia bacterium]|nr:immune inhibitor A [Dehalococcoidia bacterium]
MARGPGPTTRLRALAAGGVYLFAAASVLLGACSDGGRTPAGETSAPPTPPAVSSPRAEARPSPSSPSTDPPTVGRAATPAPTSPDPDTTRTPAAARPSPTSVEPADVPVTAGAFPVPPERDLYHLTASLVLKSGDPIPRVVNSEPVSYAEGRVDTFWLTDLSDVSNYQSQATLALVTPHAYWYVEEGLRVSRDDLERAAEAFEGQIYPRITAAFGTEWVPGVDNDPHLTILHARLSGAGGYFSSVNQYPTVVREHSNQREMVYMSSGLRIGSPQYLAVLAHELQHAIHWNADPSEETWVNEGLAEVATSVAGYETLSPHAFLRSSGGSLVNWPLDGPTTVHYGAGNLFFEYLTGRYGTVEDIALLLTEPSDGIQGVDAYLAKLGYDVAFRDVFGDWTVANYLDAPTGPYGYPDREVGVRATGRMDEPGTRTSSIDQYSAEYTAVDIIKGDVVVRFQGDTGVPLVPELPESGGCWWSNRGDSISSTLTWEVYLSSDEDAVLRYGVWFDIEEDWDYGYLQVSTDGGETWDIVATPASSAHNPVGNSYGPGYTGRSDGWIDQQVDLGAYSGGVVLVRFSHVTDDAINGLGFCVAGLSFGGGPPLDRDGRWEPDGFAWVDGPVPQEYIVRVIEVGDQVRVREIPLDRYNRGELPVTGLEDLDDLVVVVAALAPETLTPAPYTLTVDRPS